MNPVRTGSLLAAAALLLTACGGGGNNTDSNVKLPADRAGITISPALLEPTAGSNSESPLGVSYITLDKAVMKGFYYQTEFFGDGIGNVSVQPYSDKTGAIFVNFIAAQDLAPGVYNGSVRFTACEDLSCSRPLRGSPFTITTRYTVPLSVKPTTVVSLDQTEFDVDVIRGRATGIVRAAIQLQGSPQSGLSYSLEGSNSGIESTELFKQVGDEKPSSVDIRFRDSQQLDVGTYEDHLRLRVCFDAGCERQVQGSPLTLTTRYHVLATPRPDAPVLPISNSTTLPHDVVDAEYIAALDAIAIVSQAPDSRFYLYEPASNRLRSVALSAVPKAVSISPDGSTAVVGHDKSLSVIALPTSATAALSARSLLLSVNTADVVLDDRQLAHVFPSAAPSSTNISTVRTALGLETQGGGNNAFNNSRARLHPNGNVMYAAEPSGGAFSGRVNKFSISSNGLVSFVADNTTRTYNPACGDLWFSADGSRIFTACGYVFTSATSDADDLRDAGRLPLTRKPDFSYDTHRVLSLSTSASRNEVALVERDVECRTSTQPVCRDHLRLLAADTLGSKAVYTLPNRFSGNDEKQQEPLMVFQAAQNRRYLLSRALKSDGLFEYYLLTAPVQ